MRVAHDVGAVARTSGVAGPPPGRRILLALVVVAIGMFGLTVARYAPSPLRFDEIEFAAQASGIVKHGVPKLLYSEDRRLHWRAYYGYDAYYGMWHPPLYLYSLAVAVAVFGPGNAPIRGVNVAWLVLSLCLIWLMLGRLLDDQRRAVARPIAIGLVLLTPLVAEGALFVDIDNGILACLLLLLAFVFLEVPAERPALRLALLTVVFALALWSKLTTPLFMLAAMAVYHVLEGRLRRCALECVVVVVAGGTLFAATYAAYCALFDYPAWFMFDVTYWGKRGAYTSVHSLTRMLHSVRWNVVWLSPAVAAMFAIVVWRRARRYAAEQRPEKVDFLLIFALIAFFAYTVWSPTLGKYTVPAALAAVVVVAHEVAAVVPSLRFGSRALIGASLTALAIGQIVAVPALQVKRPGFNVGTASLWMAITDQRNVELAVALALAAAFCMVTAHAVRGTAWAGTALAVLLLYLLVANPINGLKVLLSSDDRSPYRPFDERGFVETVAFLNAALGENETILSPKDIGFYFRGRYYSIEEVQGFGDPAALRKVALSEEVRYVVDSVKYPGIGDNSLLNGAGSLQPIRRIGARP